MASVVTFLAVLTASITARSQPPSDAIAHEIASACAAGAGTRVTLPSTDGATGAEPSRYGAFAWTADAQGCHLTFRRSSGAMTTVLSTANTNCKFDLAMMAATRTLGTLALPALDAAGDEFHLFTFTCCGGSGVTYESWVAVVNATGAWASSVSPVPLLTMARLKETRLLLEQSPTTTLDGRQFSVAFGSLTQMVLPKVPRTISSKVTHLFAGTIRRGAHYEACGVFPIVMEIGADVIAIDEAGPCPRAPGATTLETRGGPARHGGRGSLSGHDSRTVAHWIDRWVLVGTGRATTRSASCAADRADHLRVPGVPRRRPLVPRAHRGGEGSLLVRPGRPERRME